MREALDAIGELNQELLAILVLTARSGSAQPFPLADSLRARFAQLTAVEIEAISHCGVLLADAEFTVAARWRNADGAGDSAMDQDLRGHWLTHDQAIAFGFAACLHGTLFMLHLELPVSCWACQKRCLHIIEDDTGRRGR